MAEPQLTAQKPSRRRHLAALVYEVLPVFAVTFLATLPLIAFRGGESVPVGSWMFRCWLMLAVGAYFVSGWLWGGQTMGAKAWRLRVVNDDGKTLNWRQAWGRYLIALLGWIPFGLGHWSAWLRKDRRGWHDLATGTRLVFLAETK